MRAAAAPDPGPACRWSAAVFGRNEAPAIAGCLHALGRAGGGDLHVTVLLNGSTDGSAEIAGAALQASGLRGRVYAIPLGCKANAFNQFVHRLRPPAETYFCVDAYVEVAPEALRRLAHRLEGSPEANAAAAVPTAGRSAARLRQQMLMHSGLHGSLFALRGGFVERIAALGLSLPAGFYRGDGLLGSFALHDLDAVKGGWRVERRRDIGRQFNRRVQQARGRLQWAALRHAIYPAGYGALPDDADRLTLDWIAAAPAERAPKPWRDPFAMLALRRMRSGAAGQDRAARLLAEVGAPCG